MFNDEGSFAFKKMHEYSAVDGFVEITESLAEMITFAANEPSLGLFYIQQHTQNAIPNLINLKNNVAEKSHEMALHTEDSEDSISMVRSMKECGFLIADDMVRDIKKSLAVMSIKQPKRGLITSSSWSPAMWSRNTGYRQRDGESSDGSAGTFSNVYRTAKQKASNIRWPMSEPGDPNQVKGNTMLYPEPEESEGEDLPLSSRLADLPEEQLPVDGMVSYHELCFNYEEFKADRIAKLEEWLGGLDNEDFHGARSQ